MLYSNVKHEARYIKSSISKITQFRSSDVHSRGHEYHSPMGAAAPQRTAACQVSYRQARADAEGGKTTTQKRAAPQDGDRQNRGAEGGEVTTQKRAVPQDKSHGDSRVEGDDFSA